METKLSRFTQMIQEKGDAYCDIEVVLRIIGGKWKVLILCQLFDSGRMRFSELGRELPAITQKMLTAQLRELEADGLVQRTIHPVIPPKVEYDITPLGQSLKPMLKAMQGWGHEYRVSQSG